MPSKSIREMSALERMRHSLGSRTFHAIMALVIVVSAAAIAFGFYLYINTVTREYSTQTWYLSQAAKSFLDGATTQKKCEQILEIFDSLPEEERIHNGRGEEYQAHFDVVRDGVFNDIRTRLRKVRSNDMALACYMVAIDLENDRQIYLIDSDEKDTFCPPGAIEPTDHKYLEALLKGQRRGIADTLLGDDTPIPAFSAKWENYGYRCTAATELYHTKRYTIVVCVDTDMNHVAQASSAFLFQYIILLLTVGLVMGLILSRRLKKTVVEPINEMAKAAESYSVDKNAGNPIGQHFNNLNIQTGDEIENLAWVLKDMEHDMAHYIRDLTTVAAEKERINTELNVGRQIQEGIIPHIFPAFPERKEFDLYATMHPAKEVGGDFYDFFLIDDDHLALVMADVSDKGIPAALFMMASKILINNHAAAFRYSPAEILAAVNTSICTNNPAGMFVTVWLGILEISTGVLKAANAGHEYPAILQNGGEYRLFKDPHGFVIGGMDGVRYKDYEIRLQPGDAIFEYTDGVTEAADDEEKLFGTERMIEALNEEPALGAEDTLLHMRDRVNDFVNGAAQSDDITMLCLRYLGPDSTDKHWKGGSAPVLEDLQELDIEAETEKLPEVMTFLDTWLEEHDCPMKAQMQLDVAVEELYVNIANYAYGSERGRALIRIGLQQEPRQAVITFIDSGTPYDPLKKEDPDVTLSAEDRKIGGLGIYVVKKTMDDVQYEWKDGKNVLTIRKNL